MDKEKRLDVLMDEWEHCDRCGLSEWRGGQRVSFGRGNLNADYMFILDGPTHADILDDVGPLDPETDMGALFLELIKKSGIALDNCFFTTLVGCAPLTFVPATEETPEDLKARGPKTEESKACRPRIEELIYIVDPAVVILCGENAYKDLLSTSSRGTKNTITKGYGHAFELQVPGKVIEVRYLAYPIHSPEAADGDRTPTAEHRPVRSILRNLSTIREYVKAIAA